MAPRAVQGFARNSIFGTIAGVATALGAVLGSVIVAHTLGVEGTGVVAFALWVISVAAAVADLGVQQSLARYLPELTAAGNATQAARLTVVIRRPLAIAAGIALVGFGVYGFSQLQPGREAVSQAALWALVGLACALQTLAGFTYGRLRGAQRFDSLARVTAVSVASQLVAIAAGALAFGAAGAIAGYCVGSILPALLALRRIRSDAPLAAEIRERVTRYSLYAWAGALASTVVWSRAEVFFLQHSVGSAAVGLFSVGITLANIAAQGPMLLTAALLPHFSARFGKGAVAEMQGGYATATRVLAFVVFPACFGLAAVLPTVLPVMFGAAFSDATPSATILVLAAAIGAVSSVGTSLIMAMDRSDFVFACGAIAAALTVIAGLTIIPFYGLMGAALARAAIQAAAVALGSWFIFSRLRFALPLVDLGKLLLAAALGGGIARTCLHVLPGAAGLSLAIAAGAVVYAAAVRMLRALPDGDIERLLKMAYSLPAAPRRAGVFVLLLLGRRSSRQALDEPSTTNPVAAATVRGPVRASSDAD